MSDESHHVGFDRGVDPPVALSALLLTETARPSPVHADGAIGVVLLDDLRLMRTALKALLLQDRRISLLGDTSDVQECVTLAVQRGAQMVIVNADMRDGAALTALRALAQHAPTARVLALGDGEDGGRLLLMYRAGASGYVPTQATVAELREAIESVANGNVYVRPSAAKAIATGLRNAAPDGTRGGARALLGRLSSREELVLRLVARGFSGPEIASRLGITTKTVDTYRRRIHDKLGLRHRSEFVQLAIAAGLLVE